MTKIIKNKQSIIIWDITKYSTKLDAVNADDYEIYLNYITQDETFEKLKLGIKKLSKFLDSKFQLDSIDWILTQK